MKGIGTVPNTSPLAWITTFVGVFVAYRALSLLVLQPAWVINGGINQGPYFSTGPDLSLVQFVLIFTLIGVAVGSLLDARLWTLQLACGTGLFVLGIIATGWIPGLMFGDAYGSLWTILDGGIFALAAAFTRPLAIRARYLAIQVRTLNVS
ncbi:MAG TPA: hypothetical protein VK424_02850 [Thermoplasmata archaeon]|nr:hypothetical protein [Thermoplasmata archaeon]